MSPLLVKNLDTPQYARRRESLVPNDVSMALDTRGVRTNRLLDSCISGAFTGCILHSIMRKPLRSLHMSIFDRNLYLGGRTRILAGVLTGGLISASLQYAANELNLVRIRYVSSRMADTSLPAPTNDDGSRIKPASESLSSVSPRNPEMHNLEDSAHSTKPYAFSERILDAMSYVLPMRKLAPEEYTALMEKKRLEGTHETQEQKSPRENSNGGHL